MIQADRFLSFGGWDHELNVTLEGFRDTVKTDDPAGSLTPSGNREIWSLAMEDRIELNQATLTFALSADSYRLTSTDTTVNDTALSPRVALEVPMGNAFALHASAELASRFPSLNETLVDGFHPPPATIPVRPNPNLRPERMHAFEFGLTYAHEGLFATGDALTLRATAFHNRIED